MAGCPGAGKTTLLDFMHSQGLISLEHFAVTSTDTARSLLPEYSDYLRHEPHMATSNTQIEAECIADIIMWEALARGRSIIVDGTLRRVDSALLRRIREEHPSFKIAIILVEAPFEVVTARLALRQAQTGRVVSNEYMRRIFASVPVKFDDLKGHADLSFRVSYTDGEYGSLPLLEAPMEWSAVRDTFMSATLLAPPKPHSIVCQSSALSCASDAGMETPVIDPAAMKLTLRRTMSGEGHASLFESSRSLVVSETSRSEAGVRTLSTASSLDTVMLLEAADAL